MSETTFIICADAAVTPGAIIHHVVVGDDGFRSDWKEANGGELRG
jgi:hypothetical protein